LSKDEIDKILLALDGVAAQLQTMRELVLTMASENAQLSDECNHKEIKEVRTMAGIVGAYCEECGQ
jgi:hypothetical protein